MKNKFLITATLIPAILFGAIVLPQTTSAKTITESVQATQYNCVTKGSNDIPLRVRKTPGGAVIGTIEIGAAIPASDPVKDRKGKNWTKIKYKKGFGYIPTQFISCG